ncbi:group-specific protein [Brevibacillus sp. AY1]|uniref:group-specific protein n=1 Tax=Brevibacillus sp. AY1 TaxID=2807621 RepID=UPI0024562653|nr:group-specific protein [Brevibacillus sp. AY1]MDH4620112.1 group-specific protein [Brevibacillus sp. AY1]
MGTSQESGFIKIEVDGEKIKELCRERIQALVNEVENDLIFWDRKELLRRTRMCWNTIQSQFFHDPRFPKYKVGSKWYFPAKESKSFLEHWIKEQPRY